MDARYLTEQGAAAYLSMTVARLRASRTARYHGPEIPWLKIGRLVRYDKDALDRWMAQYTRLTPPVPLIPEDGDDAK